MDKNGCFDFTILKITWVFLEDVFFHLKSSTAHIYRDETISAFAFKSQSLSLSTSVVLIPRAKDRWLRFFFNHAHGHWMLKLKTQQFLLVILNSTWQLSQEIFNLGKTDLKKQYWTKHFQPNDKTVRELPLFLRCCCLLEVYAEFNF